MKWFASDTAHIVFTHITPVVKPMHIFMMKNKVPKSCLTAELCFQFLVNCDCVPIYIFGFHHKQCTSDNKVFTFSKFTSQLFSSTDDSLKDETRLLLLWVSSLVTLPTFCLCIYHLWWSNCTSLLRATNFLKAVKWLSSVSIVLCILIVFRYTFSAFTTNSLLAIRRTSLWWSLPLSCSVVLKRP